MILDKKGRSRVLLPKMLLEISLIRLKYFRFFKFIIIIRGYKRKKDLGNCAKTLFFSLFKVQIKPRQLPLSHPPKKQQQQQQQLDFDLKFKEQIVKFNQNRIKINT